MGKKRRKEREGNARASRPPPISAEAPPPSQPPPAASASTEGAAPAPPPSPPSPPHPAPPKPSGQSWADAFAAAASVRPDDGDVLDDDFLRRTASESPGGAGGLAAVAALAREQASSTEEAGPIVSAFWGGEGEAADADAKDRPERSKEEKNKKEKKKRKKKLGNEKRGEEEERGAELAEGAASGASGEGEPPAKKRRGTTEEPRSVNGSASGVDGAAVPATEDGAALEGRMVAHPAVAGESVMVLINSRGGVVYSLVGRTRDGERAVIGEVVDDEVRLDIDALRELEGTEGRSDTSDLPFPFPADPDDHCETPLEAYKDIVPLLTKLRDLIRESKKAASGRPSSPDLAIYDPYYCNGSVVTHLSCLGFSNVHNRKEDCYGVWSRSSGTYPDFDALVTNPPCSGDHVRRLMEHVTSADFGPRPWFLLMPNWVHKKDYYVEALRGGCGGRGCRPFYLVPRRRYVYLPPKSFREKRASDVHKKSSPFVSMWYIWGGTPECTARLVDRFHDWGKTHGSRCDLARSRSALRDLRRKGKPNKKKRGW